MCVCETLRLDLFAKLVIVIYVEVDDNQTNRKRSFVINELKMQVRTSIEKRLPAKFAFRHTRGVEENYYSHCESHESSLMTRTKRRTFNKFPSHYLEIGLLSALFRFHRRKRERERDSGTRVQIRSSHYVLRESLTMSVINIST